MARCARLKSASGYQHIIIKGIGKQILFEDEMDYKYFISLMRKYSEDTELGICAYCLMDNHVHLLVHDTDNKTSLFMKKLEVSYAGYYNHKYERTGYLFQDRYRNELVEDDVYFMTVLRYILQNPEKARLYKTDNYRWSSFYSYFAEKTFLEDELIRDLFKNIERFKEYILTDITEECLDYDNKKDDEWAKRLIKQRLGIESGTIIQTYNRANRDEILKKMKKLGISIRQIERLTGLNRGIIQRA